MYFDEVIRLRQEYGYGEDRISKILPIGHSTIARWLSIFACEQKDKLNSMAKSTHKTEEKQCEVSNKDVSSLEAEILRLQSQLEYEQFRAEAYDEMIKVTESKFNISTQKKLAPNGSKPTCKATYTGFLHSVWRNKAGLL